MPRSLRLLFALGALAGCRGEPAQILSFTAAPNQVQAGQTATLSWSVKGATRVSLRDSTGAVTEGLSVTSGTREVHPVETGTWVLTAYRNELAQASSILITVSGAPRVLNFDATPQVVAPGVKSTLSWVTDGAAAVTISDGAADLPIEPTQLLGQADVFPTVTTTYTLTATGGGGSFATGAVTVEVPVPPKVLSFTATPSTVNPNQPVTLAWSVAAASEVSIKKGSNGAALSLGAKAQLAQGSYSVRPDRSESYTLTATGAGGSASLEVQVAVQPVITTFDATPPGADPADPYTLGWSTFSGVRLRLLKNTTELLLDTTDPATCDSGTFAEPAPGAAASNMYELELTSREGVKISRFLTVLVGPKPQVTAFSVTPLQLTTGKTFTVAWKTSGTTSLVIKLNGSTATTLTSAARLADGSWVSPAQANAGEVKVDLIAKSAVLSQTVQTATVTVHPPAQVTAFTATPQALPNGGDPTTLAWTTANASSAELRAGAAPVRAVAVPGGSLAVRALTSGAYTLRAFNPAGDFEERQVNVTVGSPQPALSVTPSPFVPGEELTVAWDLTTPGASAPRLSPPPYEVRTEAFADLSTTGTALALPAADDSVATLAFPAGFFFDLGPGLPAATAAVVSSNGFLTLSPAWADPSPLNLSAADPLAPPLLIAPLWDDLLLPTPEVRFGLVNADTLGVQWTGAQFRTGTTAAAGSATFQALLHRDGTVDFRYGALTSPGGEPTRAQGASATVAVSGARGSLGSEFTFNSARLAGVGAARFLCGPVTLAGSAKLRPLATVEVALVAQDSTGSPLAAMARAFALSPGSVLVNEVLPIPAAGVDPQAGEWLELRNATSALLDLSGVVLSSGAGSFTLPAGTTLPPAGLLVLGQSALTSVNGNVPVSLAWGSALTLPDAAGSAALTLRGQSVGELAWGGGAPTPTAGVSLRRDQLATFGPAAPAQATVCLASTPTPGGINGGCSYEVAVTATPLLDISGTGQDLTPAGNSSGDWRVTADFTLLSGTASPFSFPLFGTAFTKAELSSNGWMSLFNGASSGNPSSASTPRALPTTTAPNALLAPFWDDLSTSKTQAGSPPARLFVELRDPDNDPLTPDRLLIVQWAHFDLPATTVDADLNLQVVLHETGGVVEFRWGALSSGGAGARAQGAGATVGLEDSTGSIGIPVATPLSPSSGVRFTPPP